MADDHNGRYLPWQTCPVTLFQMRAMHVPISGIISLFRSIGGYLLANLAVVPPEHPGDKLERNGRVSSGVQYQSTFPASLSFLPRLWNLRAIACSVSVAQGGSHLHDKGNGDDSIKLPLRRTMNFLLFFLRGQKFFFFFFFARCSFVESEIRVRQWLKIERHSWDWSCFRNFLRN